MARRRSPEEDAWLAERYPRAANADLAREYEGRFGRPIAAQTLACWAASRGLRKPRIEWTDEMNAFLREFVPGRTEAEIRAGFAERFGHVLTESQIGNAKTRLGVRSGTHGGRFEKGRVPANKGRTWEEQGIPPEVQARMRSTCFKPGDEPVTGRSLPLGAERVSKDGYVEVKVKRLSRSPCANDCWRPKHHLVWEEASGRPVPPSTVIAFADGDKRNLGPENLVAVPRRIWAVIGRCRIPYHDRESLEAAMALAELQSGINKAACRPRRCGACGEEFEPEQPRQRTCRACLDAGRRSPRNGGNGGNGCEGRRADERR